MQPGRVVARALAIILMLGASVSAGACSNSNSISSFANSCGGSFQVFQSGAPHSAIPLCTDATDSGTARVETPDGTIGYPFPGVPSLSTAALEQCAAICAQAPSPIPCCQSQWEAQTIVCSTATQFCP
jgi:hypothetical protein